MIRVYYKGAGDATVFIELANNNTGIPSVFKTIDEACDFLLDSLHVEDSEIDEAIIQLHANNHTVMTFTPEGKLHSTGFY